MVTKNTYPVGLKLPLAKGNNGYFNQNFNTLDQAHTNIKNLLLTSIGERRLNVNFGSRVPSLLFEQVTSEEELVESLGENITQLINNFFPYVSITSVNIGFDAVNSSKINIDLTFQLKNTTEYSFGMDQTRSINLSYNLNI